MEPGRIEVGAHVGLRALCSSADRLGLGDASHSVTPVQGERSPVHDRASFLVHQMATVAGGDESCSEVECLRSKETL